MNPCGSANLEKLLSLISQSILLLEADTIFSNGG